MSSLATLEALPITFTATLARGEVEVLPTLESFEQHLHQLMQVCQYERVPGEARSTLADPAFLWEKAYELLEESELAFLERYSARVVVFHRPYYTVGVYAWEIKDETVCLLWASINEKAWRESRA